MQQLWVLLRRRSCADHPSRVCQLTYDLLKCNHPSGRSGLLFIPTSTRGICFDISKIYITGGVRGRVIKCANTFSLKLWVCWQLISLLIERLLFGFAYRMHHVTFITSGSPSHTGRMTWWAPVHCLTSTQTGAHEADTFQSKALLQHDSWWVQDELGAWAPSSCFPSRKSDSWGMGPQKPIHATLCELSHDSCHARMAAQAVVGVTLFKEASTTCFCLACKIICNYCVILGQPQSLRAYIPALWFVGDP